MHFFIFFLKNLIMKLGSDLIKRSSLFEKSGGSETIHFPSFPSSAGFLFSFV